MSRSRLDAMAVKGAVESFVGVKKNSYSSCDTRGKKEPALPKDASYERQISVRVKHQQKTLAICFTKIRLTSVFRMPCANNRRMISVGMIVGL